jgi:cellobiose-specific phosphotransferase system component IIB
MKMALIVDSSGVNDDLLVDFMRKLVQENTFLIDSASVYAASTRKVIECGENGATILLTRLIKHIPCE